MKFQPSMLVPDFVRTFEPYIPSQPDHVLKQRFGVDHLYRLNNNENPLGPPPAAASILRSMDPMMVSRYPSGDASDLRTKLAHHLDMGPDQIVPGNGATEIIQFVIKAFCESGDNIVTADKTFAVYEWVAEFSGIESRLTPLRDNRFDPKALLSFIDRRTKIVFVCNPNNPTGTYWTLQELDDFMQHVDGRCIVVLDEAYCEFVEEPDFPDGSLLVEKYPNLLVFRTFSKMYALAGLRIGYLIGHPATVYDVCRTRIVYSTNVIAQQAALAALDDKEHITRTRNMVRESRNYLEKEFERLGLPCISGQGNYIVARMPFNDQLAYRMLMKQGMMVRTMTGFRFPNHIRITLHSKPVMQRFINALEHVLDQWSASTRNPV
ncbi:histidinol-phosphate transaminase [Desulfoplanes formicivorans]|uniref:Histidinol-phosphate aminotransferase n=1 Tax=Desulfoplanes formicivorans TaxID=1592317 RepID=A0A194AJP6_9BACT|nr:histidinol-phosphate transaminase [Desulfoplanes formicivorans]GAU08954.1 histidinol-phosphate aminotransferase [Desulfoplanes formicivorans]